VVHQRWFTKGGSPKVVHQRWFTKGGSPKVVHQRWFTKGGSPIYYANLDTKTPFRITLYSLTINTILNIALMTPFGYLGIAIGASIAAWINTWLLNKHAQQYGNFSVTYETKLFAFLVLTHKHVRCSCSEATTTGT